MHLKMHLNMSHALQGRHNDHDGVSNHQPRGCLLNRLFTRRSKKTSKLRVTGLGAGNSPGPVNSPHKGPVTRKMFPFYDVIMECRPFTAARCDRVRQYTWHPQLSSIYGYFCVGFQRSPEHPLLSY